MTLIRRWAPWTVLIVVAVVGLAIGLHKNSSHPSLDAQVMHLAGEVRCPVCDGETAAQSNAAPSVDIRNQIRQELQAGQSSSQILAGIVHDYGEGILEKPQPSGVGLLVWILPVIAVAAMLAGLVLAFSRWRAKSLVLAAPVGAEPEPASPEVDDVAVNEPIVLPEADPAAQGDPVGTSLAAPPLRGVRKDGRRRLAVMGAGALLITGGICWAIVAASSTRLPGQTITGAALGPEVEATDLQTAQTDAIKGNDVDAIKEYQKVLASDPSQPEALAGEGWLLAETQQPSLLQEGITMLTEAEAADPTYSPAHVYRGIALLSEDDYADSIPELQWYLAHDPDPSLAAKVKTALQQAETALKETKSSPAAPTTTTTRP